MFDRSLLLPPTKISSNNYFPRNDKYRYGKLDLVNGADFSFNYIENEKGDVVKLGFSEAMKSRQKNYFHRKKIMDMDFNGKNYLEYLQGKIQRIEPNPYNKHIDYLGDSNLSFNSITNPMSNKLENKLLFGKKYFVQKSNSQHPYLPYGIEINN